MSFCQKRDQGELDGFRFAFDDALDGRLQTLNFFACVKDVRERFCDGFGFFDTASNFEIPTGAGSTLGQPSSRNV